MQAGCALVEQAEFALLFLAEGSGDQAKGFCDIVLEVVIRQGFVRETLDPFHAT